MSNSNIASSTSSVQAGLVPSVLTDHPSSLSGNEPLLCTSGPLVLPMLSASTNWLPDVATPSSNNQVSLGIPAPSNMTQSLFVPPPLACQHCPFGMKALYLPAPPPVFVLPGHQHHAQDTAAIPHRPQHQPVDVFNAVNELELSEVGLPSCLSGSQKCKNQW
ncbi:hypothetical protein M404DRAFT_19774 [Pisolithus tinctorius Marx 270]|uniref:Uncharacterized protein n=1 Tax=Pisolithus tinctorius Marx 270 TaxID=870435 RepID=A0A0C3PTD1_PISTI|nr:hypothetical protein M404DRAFT_19774 [Pisolithus tinctorius Marx 270]